MGKIVILDENTSNQIAAGEVVERPASVVKELVENSIDAGSTNISVEINSGGISLIKVVDNGSGIDEDDMEIAFERHSTSKIRRANDLEAITTLGFRGEALASIASVSIVELTSRPADKPFGRYIKIKGGSLIESSQTGCPVGTTFVVRDLFYNTPARFKFLKKDSTEAGYVSDIINRIALGNPEVSFRLINNRNTVIHTPGNNDLLSTIFSLYGKETAKECMKVCYEDEKIKIEGYAGKPEIARSNRNYQSIYINGRYIKNKVISSAIDEAYKTYLLKNKFAFIVLNIEINPMLVDVNVHPTKMEVRFSGEQDIFRSVYHAINNALLSKSHIRNVELPEKSKNYFKFEENYKKKADYVQQGLDTSYKNTKSSEFTEIKIKKEVMEDNIKPELEIKPQNVSENIIVSNIKDVNANKNSEYIFNDSNNCNGGTVKEETDSKEAFKTENNRKENYIEKPNARASETVPDNNNDHLQDNAESNLTNKATDIKNKDKTHYTDNDRSIILNSKIIGQAFSTYILLQNADNLILIDQHAAHERIKFEELKEKYKRNENLSQYLLTSVVIELTNQEISCIEEEKKLLNKLGFIFESFGNNSIILRSVPVLDESVGIKEAFLEIVDFLIAKGKKNDTIIEEEALYQIACKSAVKANKRLDEIEIRSILENLQNLENPYTCPHGRPTIIKITKYEFEKMFKRIV